MAAQRRALSGLRRGGMREATRQRRERIDELTALATQELVAAGVAAGAHRADVVATFDAASAGEDAATRVGAARLSQALPVSSDLATLSGLTVLSPRRATGRAGRRRRGRGRPRRRARRARASWRAGPGTAADARGGADPATLARQEAALARRRAIRAVSVARRDATEAGDVAERAVAQATRAEARAAAADTAATAAEQTAHRLRRDAADLAGRAASARTRAQEATAARDVHTSRLRDLEAQLRDLDDDA